MLQVQADHLPGNRMQPLKLVVLEIVLPLALYHQAEDVGC